MEPCQILQLPLVLSIENLNLSNECIQSLHNVIQVGLLKMDPAIPIIVPRLPPTGRTCAVVPAPVRCIRVMFLQLSSLTIRISIPHRRDHADTGEKFRKKSSGGRSYIHTRSSVFYTSLIQSRPKVDPDLSCLHCFLALPLQIPTVSSTRSKQTPHRSPSGLASAEPSSL
mmetsp:Transcript_46269/g.145129  ORF Transcript_46269/g.145129 Transcript_46269/m.145129 type:complete len:170 (+) Transcript_46269:124-633(+)